MSKLTDQMSFDFLKKSESSSLVETVPHTKTEPVASQGKSMKQYWGTQFIHAVRAARQAQVEKNLFSGWHDLYGRSPSELTQSKVMSYLKNPSIESWLSIRGIPVAGSLTLGHAFALADPRYSEWQDDCYAGPEVLKIGIQMALNRRAQEAGDHLFFATH